MDALTGAPVTLDDKYVADHGRIYLTGVQALVRDLNRRLSDFLHGFAILTWMRPFPQPIPLGQKSRST